LKTNNRAHFQSTLILPNLALPLFPAPPKSLTLRYDRTQDFVEFQIWKVFSASKVSAFYRRRANCLRELIAKVALYCAAQ